MYNLLTMHNSMVCKNQKPKKIRGQSPMVRRIPEYVASTFRLDSSRGHLSVMSPNVPIAASLDLVLFVVVSEPKMKILIQISCKKSVCDWSFCPRIF